MRFNNIIDMHIAVWMLAQACIHWASALHFHAYTLKRIIQFCKGAIRWNFPWILMSYKRCYDIQIQGKFPAYLCYYIAKFECTKYYYLLNRDGVRWWSIQNIRTYILVLRIIFKTKVLGIFGANKSFIIYLR